MPQLVIGLEKGVDLGNRRADRRDPLLDQGKQRGALAPEPRPQRLGLLREQAKSKAAMPLPARRPALAAMHATDREAAHRRLPAGPVFVPAARLATRGEPELAAPVAIAQRSTAHGVNHRLAAVVPCPGPHRMQVQHCRGTTQAASGELQDFKHNKNIIR
ncbi:MAG: hypothetical protein FJX53_13935, partial [Alphaproteobacteria bacterium]|nr:hypothetical protein [Alphaproteobacteria bacterium]